MDKVREIALKALYKIDKENAYSNIVLDQVIKQNKDKINKKDIGLISEIIYGVTSWKLTLDEIIKKYSKIKINKISPWILNILRMGIYQIVFLDKIPKSAAVNESVNLAKRYGHKSSSNFVNAILRKIDKTDYETLSDTKGPVEKISITNSMPIWIVEEILKSNNIEETEQICKNLNFRPKTIIRINTLKTTVEEVENKLKEENIEFKKTEIETFLILEKIKNIEELSLFKEGYFTVQDLSAGEASITLNPQPKEKILDACSSPGGKTTHMAELMKNDGKIEAWDIHENRIKLVEENAKRLGINVIYTKLQDATQYNDKLKEKYDKILLDVPCLGIGVIKRKPDIKWQRKKEDLEKITAIQLKILSVCSKYVKKGGEILYSTCSILEEENRGTINRFLDTNVEFKIVKEKVINPNKIQDGFYICKLKKSL